MHDLPFHHVTQGTAPLFGAPPPPVHEDHVRVYSTTMQMTLPSIGDSPRSTYGGSTMLDPPLSPSTVPLRGYAAEPLQIMVPAPEAAPSTSAPGRASPHLETKAEAHDREYTEMMQSIRARATKRGEEHEQEEDRRIERLLKYLQDEEEWVSSVDRKLKLREEQRWNRKTELYKEWEQKVFKVVQRQIDEQLARIRTEEISERRRALMEDYIRTNNKKLQGLYLDIIIESEYDPFVAHKKLMRYQMSDLSDPLKQEVNAFNTLPSGKLKPKPKWGRDSLPVTLWDKLDSTPFGRFDRLLVDNPPPQEPRADRPHFSRVNFDHYRISTNRADLDREFPRGKRIGFGGSARDQRSSTIFEPMG